MSDVERLLESRRSRIGRWAAAAVVVCALHVGGVALALMTWQEEDVEDDAAGAMTVELAPLPAPVRVDSPDLAHGPNQQEARLTQEAAKEVVEEVVKDIPPVDPSPAPEPEVVLPKAQPEEKEKPKEEEAQQPVPEQERPQQDRDTIATAPPRVDVQPTPETAVSPGQAAALAQAQARWQKAIFRHLERFKRYPTGARRQSQQGRVVVRFRVDRSGHVVASHILKGSGAPLLDEEVFALLKRGSPLPAPPDLIPDAELEMDVPIQFTIK
jgi:periplasmic protein TonB